MCTDFDLGIWASYEGMHVSLVCIILSNQLDGPRVEMGDESEHPRDDVNVQAGPFDWTSLDDSAAACAGRRSTESMLAS